MKLFADNLVRINENDLKNYVKLKENSDIDGGDFVHIGDDIYAELSDGNIICKQKVTKFNTFLRKK